MPEGKAKFIEDAARVIDGRVKALKDELARNREFGHDQLTGAADRAAILEAEYLAKMIRTLHPKPYRGDPYKVARERLGRGTADV